MRKFHGVRLLTRSGAALAASTLLAATAVTPAGAADAEETRTAHATLTQPSVTKSLDESTPGATIFVSGTIFDFEKGEPLKTMTMTVDAGAVAGKLILSPADETCRPGEIITCEVPIVSGFSGSARARLNVKVAAGATVGEWVKVPLGASAEGLKPSRSEDHVRIVGSGPNLLVEKTVVPNLRANDVARYRPVIRNNGDEAADSIWLRMEPIDLFFSDPKRYGNCWYDDGRHAGGVKITYCEVPTRLSPGDIAQVAADTPLLTQALPLLPNKWFNSMSIYAGAGTAAEFRKGTRGDGPGLTVDVTPSPVSVRPNGTHTPRNTGAGQGEVRFEFGANPGDLAAVPADIRGEVGSVSTVTLAIRNNGPAFLLGQMDGSDLAWDSSREAQPKVRVSFPAGVEVLATPENEQFGEFCSGTGKPAGTPLGLVFDCGANDNMIPGQEWEYTFKVKITGTASAPGSIVASGGGNDPDPSNNTAPLTLNGQPAGGASPPGPGTTPGATPGAAPDGDGNGGAASGGSGGGLPITGTPVAVVALTGAVAAIAGFVMYRASRRRRLKFVISDK